MPNGKVTAVTKPQRGVMISSGQWMFSSAAQEDAVHALQYDFSQVLKQTRLFCELIRPFIHSIVHRILHT